MVHADELVTPEQMLLEIDAFLIRMVALIVILVLLFYIASKFAKEMFDWIDYMVVCSMMFVTVFVSYLVLATFLQAAIDSYQILSLENLWLVNLVMFLSYFLIFLIPFYVILLNTFMFFKTRAMVTLSFSGVIALLITLFAGVM